MKIEPMEYVVTFDDGEDKVIGICDDGLWHSYDYDWERHSCETEGFTNFKEALEALKKWKEKKS